MCKTIFKIWFMLTALSFLLSMVGTPRVVAQEYWKGLDIDTLESVVDTEEYEVVSALLKDIYPFPQYERYFYCLQLNRVTLGYGAICGIEDSAYLWEFFPRYDSTIQSECIESFASLNKFRYRWTADFSLSTPYRWADYGHPRNENCSYTISLSRAGFDASRQRAIIVYSVKWEHRGSDDVAHLEKVDGAWRVVKRTTYINSD